MLIYRYLGTPVDNYEIAELTSHGRGRWFESSIAHSHNSWIIPHIFRSQVLPSAGHVPQLTHPDEYVRAVVEFIQAR